MLFSYRKSLLFFFFLTFLSAISAAPSNPGLHKWVTNQSIRQIECSDQIAKLLKFSLLQTPCEPIVDHFWRGRRGRFSGSFPRMGSSSRGSRLFADEWRWRGWLVGWVVVHFMYSLKLLLQTLHRLQMNRHRRRQRENERMQKRLEMQRLNAQDQEDIFIDAILSGKPIYVEQQSKRSIGKYNNMWKRWFYCSFKQICCSTKC